MAKKPPSGNTICENRKARFRFQILDPFECGIVLRGTEVKSLRDRNASLEEAYALIEKGELWLIGCHIATYKFGHADNHEPLRRRKLLIHRRQLERLRPKVEQKGQTLVPLRLYFNERGLAKITISLGRGKRQTDKRQDLKARDHKREMERAMRQRH